MDYRVIAIFLALLVFVLPAATLLKRWGYVRRHKKMFCCLGITVVLLAGSEAGLRIYPGLGNPELYCRDDKAGYFLVANQDVVRFGNRICVNCNHQRTHEVPDQPRPGELRILCVGDSVTCGGAKIDQADLYTELLERHLADRGVTAEVLNASAPGWATGNEAGYLAKYGVFNSRILVMQVGSDDLMQETNSGHVVGSVGTPDKKPMLALAEAVTRYGWMHVREWCGIGSPLPAGAQREQCHAQAMAAFRSMVAQARRCGMATVVLHTAYQAEVVPANGQFDTTRDDLRRRFFAICQELDVPVVDLATLWKSDPKAATYFYDDIHMTTEGHRDVATRLTERLLPLCHAPASSQP